MNRLGGNDIGQHFASVNTEAAVSSHEDSMPRMFKIGLLILVVFVDYFKVSVNSVIILSRGSFTSIRRITFGSCGASSGFRLSLRCCINLLGSPAQAVFTASMAASISSKFSALCTSSSLATASSIAFVVF